MYASTQQSHSSWTAADFKYQGYSNNCDTDWRPVSLLISIAVMTVALTTIALMKAAPKLYQKVASNVEKGNQWYSFFWAASFMTSLCNIALLFGEICPPALINFIENEKCHNWEIFAIMYGIKIAIVGLAIIFGILVAICIPKSAEFPIPSIVYILSYPICCTFCCCSCCCCTRCRHSRHLRLKWIQTLALTSLLLFTQFIALSALPTILWAFVLPVQTLAAVTFLAAAMFCLTALIAVLIRNIGQLMCSGRSNCYSSFMQLLMVILLVAIVISTGLVYINFIISGTKTNQVGGFIVSFLPSAILTILGWFVAKGKFIEQVLPQENDSTRNRSLQLSEHLLP